VPELAPLEIQALVRIMDELSYYQILHVEPDASSLDIKKAYYQSARTFHPDATRHLDVELQKSCLRISKCVTEAYCVLRDPRKRKSYDEKLTQGEGIRIQLSEARAAHAKRDSAERTGETAQGRQFLHKAEENLRLEDYAAAIGNLQMALTFEPGNEFIKEKLGEARKLRR
jgi:DnaJ-class molecular chaperone